MFDPFRSTSNGSWKWACGFAEAALFISPGYTYFAVSYMLHARGKIWRPVRAGDCLSRRGSGYLSVAGCISFLFEGIREQRAQIIASLGPNRFFVAGSEGQGLTDSVKLAGRFGSASLGPPTSRPCEGR